MDNTVDLRLTRLDLRRLTRLDPLRLTCLDLLRLTCLDPFRLTCLDLLWLTCIDLLRLTRIDLLRLTCIDPLILTCLDLLRQFRQRVVKPLHHSNNPTDAVVCGLNETTSGARILVHTACKHEAPSLRIPFFMVCCGFLKRDLNQLFYGDNRNKYLINTIHLDFKAKDHNVWPIIVQHVT